jgi:hypothetical protein
MAMRQSDCDLLRKPRASGDLGCESVRLAPTRSHPVASEPRTKYKMPISSGIKEQLSGEMICDFCSSRDHDYAYLAADFIASEEIVPNSYMDTDSFDYCAINVNQHDIPPGKGMTAPPASAATASGFTFKGFYRMRARELHLRVLLFKCAHPIKHSRHSGTPAESGTWLPPVSIGVSVTTTQSVREREPHLLP